MTVQTKGENLEAPAKRKVRIQALDTIRGLAILGVLAVNADGFAAPIVASLKPLNWPFPNQGWTAISYWVMDAFFHDKFLTLFSMLFGVSLFLVGGERDDKVRGVVLLRRLLVLLGFGMLHGFGIWWGDILSLYAITGFIMFFLRSWPPKTLLFVGIALFVVMTCRQLPLSVFGPVHVDAATHTNGLNPIANHPPGSHTKIAADIASATSSWQGAYHANTHAYLRVLSGDRVLLPWDLALMMIGLSLFKSGYLAGKSTNRRYLGMMTIGAIALGIVAWLSWHAYVEEVPIMGTAFTTVLLAPLISLAYAALIVLILRTRASTLLAPLAATGRMAFTNYLTQSLIMTTIFYGGRGALMGQIDRPKLWCIVLSIWALQLIWSPLWLSRFESGPFEWIWRCLTFGRRMPFVKRGSFL
jgi:uncharacterized protein